VGVDADSKRQRMGGMARVPFRGERETLNVEIISSLI
jgi:hypothetical protein